MSYMEQTLRAAFRLVLLFYDPAEEVDHVSHLTEVECFPLVLPPSWPGQSIK